MNWFTYWPIFYSYEAGNICCADRSCHGFSFFGHTKSHVKSMFKEAAPCNHRPPVLRHCWLSHLTRKIERTYNVSSGTSNPTIPCYTCFMLRFNFEGCGRKDIWRKNSFRVNESIFQFRWPTCKNWLYLCAVLKGTAVKKWISQNCTRRLVYIYIQKLF